MSRRGWILAGLATVLFLVNLTLQITRIGLESPEVDISPAVGTMPVGFLVAGLIGAVLTSRLPGNRVGWILVALGTTGMALELLREYGIYALVREPGSLPLGPEAAWLWDWSWIFGMGLVPLLILYFPSGSLLSPRWKAVLWANATWVALFALDSQHTWHDRSAAFLASADVEVSNPPPLSAFLQTAGISILALTLLACVWNVFSRYRRAGGIERHQLKWLAYSSAFFAVANLVTYVLFGGEAEVLVLVAGLSIAALPISIGLAIFKYRLYDIDVVINKTLVYGALAGFITAIYVGIVVGIGTILGAGDEPNLGLSIVATALIAVAFQPFKQRVQTMANRMVYGKRSTPYEVLADFSAKMAGSAAQEELLSQMAETLAEGTGAESAHVWVKVGDRLQIAGSFHRFTGADDTEEAAHHPIPVTRDVFTVPDADRVAAVVHEGELLGALSVNKRSGEQMTPVEDKLMSDLAAQAGVVLRNVRLTEELLQRLEELKASRQRLVAAQNSARRRLERDLHDGAQQQLVALKVKLSLAQRLTTQEKVKQFLTQLQSEADETLQTLRDLARGIYPPLLADKGLPSALIAQANKSTLAVEIRAEGIGRYPQEVEAAVYFCCLEALQNVAKYAGPCQVAVTLSADAGNLSFEVADTGTGFDYVTTSSGHGIQNMSDRMDALGGELQVTSEPGKGTRVKGIVPVRALEPVG